MSVTERKLFLAAGLERCSGFWKFWRKLVSIVLSSNGWGPGKSDWLAAATAVIDCDSEDGTVIGLTAPGLLTCIQLLEIVSILELMI